MYVVLAVATATGGRQRELGDIPNRMARLAQEALVLSAQRILCLSGVIEPPASPAIRIVTRSAIGSEAPLMVSVLMTVRTYHRCLLE